MPAGPAFAIAGNDIASVLGNKILGRISPVQARKKLLAGGWKKKLIAETIPDLVESVVKDGDPSSGAVRNLLKQVALKYASGAVFGKGNGLPPESQATIKASITGVIAGLARNLGLVSEQFEKGDALSSGKLNQLMAIIETPKFNQRDVPFNQIEFNQPALPVRRKAGDPLPEEKKGDAPLPSVPGNIPLPAPTGPKPPPVPAAGVPSTAAGLLARGIELLRNNNRAGAEDVIKQASEEKGAGALVNSWFSHLDLFKGQIDNFIGPGTDLNILRRPPALRFGKEKGNVPASAVDNIAFAHDVRYGSAGPPNAKSRDAIKRADEEMLRSLEPILLTDFDAQPAYAAIRFKMFLESGGATFGDMTGQDGIKKNNVLIAQGEKQIKNMRRYWADKGFVISESGRTVGPKSLIESTVDVEQRTDHVAALLQATHEGPPPASNPAPPPPAGPIVPVVPGAGSATPTPAGPIVPVAPGAGSVVLGAPGGALSPPVGSKAAASAAAALSKLQTDQINEITRDLERLRGSIPDASDAAAILGELKTKLMHAASSVPLADRGIVHHTIRSIEGKTVEDMRNSVAEFLENTTIAHIRESAGAKTFIASRPPPSATTPGVITPVPGAVPGAVPGPVLPAGIVPKPALGAAAGAAAGVAVAVGKAVANADETKAGDLHLEPSDATVRDYQRLGPDFQTIQPAKIEQELAPVGAMDIKMETIDFAYAGGPEQWSGGNSIYAGVVTFDNIRDSGPFLNHTSIGQIARVGYQFPEDIDKWEGDPKYKDPYVDELGRPKHCFEMEVIGTLEREIPFMRQEFELNPQLSRHRDGADPNVIGLMNHDAPDMPDSDQIEWVTCLVADAPTEITARPSKNAIGQSSVGLGTMEFDA